MTFDMGQNKKNKKKIADASSNSTLDWLNNLTFLWVWPVKFFMILKGELYDWIKASQIASLQAEKRDLGRK